MVIGISRLDDHPGFQEGRPDMGNWHRGSTAKRLADYLRQELARGRWQGKMPG